MGNERGIVCMFCGEGFGYCGEKPDDETMKAAVDHEKVCPENPYLAEISDLKGKFRIATVLASEYKAWVEKAESELALESRALELACNKLFSEGVIIEEDTDEPAIQPSPDHFRKRARLTL